MAKAKTSGRNVVFEVHGSKKVNPETFGFWPQALDYAVEAAAEHSEPVHIDIYCTLEGWRVLEEQGILPDLDHLREEEAEFPEFASRAPYNARFTVEASFVLGKLL